MIGPGLTWLVLLVAALGMMALVWLLGLVLDAMFSAPGAPESSERPEADLGDPLDLSKLTGPPPWRF